MKNSLWGILKINLWKNQKSNQLRNLQKVQSNSQIKSLSDSRVKIHRKIRQGVSQKNHKNKAPEKVGHIKNHQGKK